MKLIGCFVVLMGLQLAASGRHQHRTLIPNLFDRLTHRVDTLTDRIDTGLQHTLNPVFDQLHQNMRDTLNIWARPFSGLASGHSGPPMPVAPPSQTPPERQDAPGPFDFGLSPLLQGLFDSQPREWWKGPNVCIERQEIDETKGVNRTLFAGEAAPAEAAEGDAVVDDDEDATEAPVEGPVDAPAKRQSRQFNAHVRMSSCSDEGLSYVCETKIRSNGVRKTYKTRYACCFGTTREAREFGCHAVELRSLQETVFALGGRSFLTLMKEAAVDQRNTARNRTYFVPVDRSAPEATGDAANDVNADETAISFNEGELKRKRRQAPSSGEWDDQAHTEMRTTVLSHMVSGVYLTTDFHDEQMLQTEDADAKIRINMYNAPDRVYTANCVRLVSTNHYSQQGVVHMLDGVMKPATKTISQLLESEPHFSSFRNLIGNEFMAAKLSEPGQFTVFAPTDEAFAKLDTETRERLMKGESCIHSVLKQHLLPNVICSTVIKGRARSTTMLGSSLVMERDLEGKLYVNGKQVITRDVMASNGVLHVIDGVLIPETARSFSQLLSSRNLTEFSRIVEATGLTSFLDTLSNATLFAPSNEAIRALPDDIKQSWMTNPDAFKQVLLNHISRPQLKQSAVNNNQLVPTELSGQSLRINIYHSIPLFNGLSVRATAQCSPIMRWEQEACNGNVHTVDRVLMPPSMSIAQWLANNRSFSIMSKLLKDTGLAEILNAEGPYTVMAAPDVAFYQMPEEQLSEMTKNSSKASAVLKQMILPEQVCCTGFRGDWFTTNRRRTMDGNWIPLQRHLDGHLTAGDSEILACDRLATNGVIHVIDKVLSPKSPGGLPFLSGTRRVGLPLAGVELLFNGGK